MNTEMFYYDLPEEYIAQTPVQPRDHSKLMVYNRSSKKVEHRHFYDICDYLRPGDALVINETKVMPARLFGKKVGSGGAIQFLLLKRIERDVWEVILKPGKKATIGSKFVFGDELYAEVIDIVNDGNRIVRFTYEGVFEEVLDRLGQMPLPPYIVEKLEDKERYQTVYAKEPGSAAAPTAGLHFTKELLEKIKGMGVEIIPILLHVGLGTFRPVKVKNVEEHKMHSEYYMLSQEAADRINAVRERGGRIISVGTTSTRVLETVADEKGYVKPASGWTDIFIYPGYQFKCVDALITNFHLPESTLLMLVSAFCSREEMLNLYETAKAEKYRFFSFGDAMFLI